MVSPYLILIYVLNFIHFQKSVFVIALLAILSVHADEKYTTKYDNIDLEELVKNERLLKSYVDCLMDKGSCSPDGQELKSKPIYSSFIISYLIFCRKHA